jgi:hypothetical protein
MLVALPLLFLSLSFVAARATLVSPALTGVRASDPLQRGQLVVRAQVVAIRHSSTISGDLLNRNHDVRSSAILVHAEIDEVDVRVLELLRGGPVGPTVTFVALPRWRFREGQELIVCAKWVEGRKLSAHVTNWLMGALTSYSKPHTPEFDWSRV